MSPSKIITTPSGKKTYFTTPNPFEKQFGYHRAVKKGPFIYVSGTTALKLVDENGDKDEDTSNLQTTHDTNDSEILKSQSQNESKVHHPNSTYDQGIVAMERCIDAVGKLGGKVEDIVRVRMFVGNPDYCSDIGNAFRECFGGTTGEDDKASEIGVAATMIVVQDGFVDKDIRVEVEVDAVVL